MSKPNPNRIPFFRPNISPGTSSTLCSVRIRSTRSRLLTGRSTCAYAIAPASGRVHVMTSAWLESQASMYG